MLYFYHYKDYSALLLLLDLVLLVGVGYTKKDKSKERPAIAAQT
jgi:hypothetical protein